MTQTERKAPNLHLVASAANATLSDDELVDAIERGDSGVGAILYRRLAPTVDSAVYRVMGRRQNDHDDLVQAAFEQILVTLYKKRFARACSLKSWASAVTCNVALHALRARRSERRVFDNAVDGQESGELTAGRADAERRLGARHELERLRYHLLQMNENRARAVLMHDVLGQELSEIAVVTGVSVAAAQSRLVRGRRELLERMAKDGERRPRGDT